MFINVSDKYIKYVKLKSWSKASADSLYYTLLYSFRKQEFDAGFSINDQKHLSTEGKHVSSTSCTKWELKVETSTTYLFLKLSVKNIELKREKKQEQGQQDSQRQTQSLTWCIMSKQHRDSQKQSANEGWTHLWSEMSPFFSPCIYRNRPLLW